MSEVFISYSRKDRPVAEALAAALTARGVDVWWDHELLGGDDYRKKTARIIESARAAIVIWSRRSIDSEWVTGEASAARTRKILIPVAIDQTEPPLDFRSLNNIDMSQWLPGDPLPDALLRAVCEKTGRDFSPDQPAQEADGGKRFTKLVARSWYADFETLLFSLIAQGFASALTNIPLAVHQDDLPVIVAAGIATLNATVTAAIIMRTALSSKRLALAAFWFCVAIAVGVAGYFLTATLWRTLDLNEFMVFVGFWALALILVLDTARRVSGR